MSVRGITGRIEIPKEILDVARLGLFRKSEWKRVFKYVEKGAMGAGGILEDNLQEPDVQTPLSPATLARKRKQGLPSTALIGKRGRIQKALRNPSSTFRKREVFKSRKGGMVLRVFFNPAKFEIPGKKDTITRVLQRGRLKAFDRVKYNKVDSKLQETSRVPYLEGRAAVLAAKGRRLPGKSADGSKVVARRMPGRPVLSYYSGNEAKLTPALLKSVYIVLREKGLSQ